MRDIGAALTARGVAPERVLTEAFGTVAVHASGLVKTATARRTLPTGELGTGPAITFARSHLTVAWDDRYPSLLDFAEACDVPVGFGCRNGVCHNCESGLLAGTVSYAPTRSSRRPKAGSSSAAAARPPSSRSTCRRLKWFPP